MLRSARALWGALAALSLAACGGGGGGGVGGDRTSEDRASVAVDARAAARNSDPGDFAADYLRDVNFDSIRIEVDYPAESPPSVEALELLRVRLAERCTKPGGIELVLDDAIPSDEFAPVLAAADLEELEDRHRDEYADLAAGVATVYVLCVPGNSDQDTSGGTLIGLAYRGASLALFVDNADQGGDPWVTTAEMEATALVHEAGHLLGLVNSGVPMVGDHEDPAHPHHDTDPASVLYWAIEVPRVAPNLGDPDFAQFGAACIADLRAFGGR